MISLGILFTIWLHVFAVSFFAIYVRKLASKLKPIKLFNLNPSTDQLLNSFKVVPESVPSSSPCIVNANTYLSQLKIAHIIKKKARQSAKEVIDMKRNSQSAIVKHTELIEPIGIDFSKFYSEET